MDDVATMLSTKAAKYLGISVQMLRKLHKQGKLVPLLVLEDGIRLYSKTQLDNYMREKSNRLVDS